MLMRHWASIYWYWQSKNAECAAYHFRGAIIDEIGSNWWPRQCGCCHPLIHVNALCVCWSQTIYHQSSKLWAYAWQRTKMPEYHWRRYIYMSTLHTLLKEHYEVFVDGIIAWEGDTLFCRLNKMFLPYPGHIRCARRDNFSPKCNAPPPRYADAS